MIAVGSFFTSRLPVNTGNLEQDIFWNILTLICLSPLWLAPINLIACVRTYRIGGSFYALVPAMFNLAVTLPYFIGRRASDNEEELLPVFMVCGLCVFVSMMALLFAWSGLITARSRAKRYVDLQK